MIWGIDLGGTKVEGVVLDDARKVKSRLRLPTEQARGYDHILGQIGAVIGLMQAETGATPTRLGIGTPGTIDPRTGTLKNSNTLCLNDRPIKADLERLLGIPVSIANDANCFALAEATLGAVPDVMPDAKVVFGIIMGTGAGGGLVVNGEVLHGRQGNGGEWGHNFLHESGGACYCGKTGCVEKVIAGPALEAFYAAQSGTHRSLKVLWQRHLDRTDPLATLTFDRLRTFFAQAVSVIINIIDPDVIVIGGGVGNIPLLYDDITRDLILYHTFNNRLDTIFTMPKLGDSAGVFGAAMLVA